MNTAAIKRRTTQQHEEWVPVFPQIISLLTSCRRNMVFPCRYCRHTEVNRHTHWRTCITLQRLATCCICTIIQAMEESLEMSAHACFLSGHMPFRSGTQEGQGGHGHGSGLQPPPPTRKARARTERGRGNRARATPPGTNLGVTNPGGSRTFGRINGVRRTCQTWSTV